MNERNFGGRSSGPMVVEAGTLPNHEMKVAVVVPAGAIATVVGKILITVGKQSLAGEESQRRTEKL